MVFSTNQARQFYVMKGAVQETAPTTSNTIQLVTADPNAPYIVAMGAVGTLRSDLLTNIESVKVTDAAALAKKLKSTKVTLTSNGGAVVGGQDYILNIEFSQFAGISDEEKYFKHAMVHGTSGMTAHTFYKTLADSLVKNLSRDISKLVAIQVVKASDHSAIDATAANLASMDASDSAHTIEAVLINEASQVSEWRLGVKAATPVYFTVTTGTIKVSGDEVLWGTITDNTTTFAQTIGNGVTIADMEYFYMGERGDIYRKINWPNNIDTKYLVDATQTYDVLDVHYSYIGTGEGVQKSEKDLVIVAPHSTLSGDMSSNPANIEVLANKIAKAAGFGNFKEVTSTGAITNVTVSQL